MIRRTLAGLNVAFLALTAGLLTATPAQAKEPSSPKSFSVSCTTGAYKPSYTFSGFDINTANTTMDATKTRLRTLSKATGRDSSYRIQWSRIVFNSRKANGGVTSKQWNGSVRGRNGGPRAHRAQSWNPSKVNVVNSGGPFIHYIRLQVQVDRNHVCNSAWKRVN